jgi:hypothetical protein
MNKTAVFVACFLTLLPSVASSAEQYWNGSECITCPEGPFSGSASPAADSGTGSGGGATPVNSSLLPPEGLSFLGAPVVEGPQVVTAPGDSMMYTIVGPVRSVSPDKHTVILKNRATHRNKTVYVYDPIIYSLTDRNVVEVWLKPGDDTAQRIHRIS